MTRKTEPLRQAPQAALKHPIFGSGAPVPAFPETVRIPARKGAVISTVALPDAQAIAEAALILPAPAEQAGKRTRRTARKVAGKRGQKTRRRKPGRAKSALAKSGAGTAKSGKSSSGKSPSGASGLGRANPASAGETGTAPNPMPNRSADAAAAVPPAGAVLPPNRALVPVNGLGVVGRLVRWLDAISFAVVGKPLPRKSKRRRNGLPLARQVSPLPAITRRVPPLRQSVAQDGEAGDELARLRAENARLKAQLAQLAPLRV
ncbi:MAG: hypothetical protein ACKOPQ_06835 [Novosphingobium sp.]